MTSYSLGYEDWLRGWREWARTRKRGKMAQFIVEKLEEGNQAQWLDINNGVFELTEWHAIAKEWFGEKPRNSEAVDAPCMLRKGLPRAFPGLDEIKEKSKKEGTQYRSRVFKAPQPLLNDVLLHITNHPNAGAYVQNGAADHMPYSTPRYPHYTGYNVTTSNPAVSSGSSYYDTNQPLRAVFNSSQPTGVEMDLQQPSSQNQDYPQEHFLPPGAQQQGYGNEIDMYVQAITDNGSESGAGYHPSTSSSSNGFYNYPSPMLGVPSPGAPGFPTKEEMGSPPSGPPPYGHSPGSTHSPRISPEPSTISYPPSVQQQQQPNVFSGPEMSPASTSSPTVVTEPECMKIKINPTSSPLEGGGQMVLIFYSPLPIGKKVVAFCSLKNKDLAFAQEAYQENMMALVCQIPVYPYPDEVEVRVYNYNQIIARTTFVFYQQSLQLPPSEMILQILSSQLQSHFPGGSGMQGANGGSNGSGDQILGSSSYGYIPSSMYQLLLGACRLGCEPLVHCLLCSPVMEGLTQEQIKEAFECAQSNSHESLSELLMELLVLHNMTAQLQYIPRGGEGNNQPQKNHVPAYYDVLDGLDQGGQTPQARAETVLNQLLTAMKDSKDLSEETKPHEEKKPVEEDEPVEGDLPENQQDVTTPVIEITPNLGVSELTIQMDQSSLSPRRRLSSSAKLKRQPNSISDEDEDLRGGETSLKSPVVFHSRESWAEVNDVVPDLVSHRKKHPFTQQSDADSAIGMSFEEETNTLVSSEMQRRRSSLMAPSDMFGQQNDSILIKLNPEMGLEVANALEWEGYIVVTEDYPPNQDKKIFCKGDKIVQVGDRLVRGMSALDFSEHFQSEAAVGTTARVLPVICTAPQQFESTPVSQKVLRRTASEQAMLENIKTKINQLLAQRAPSAERKVTLPRTTSGHGIKIIGGKTVGVFISDVRSDITQLSQGDQILEVNGQSTRSLTLYDVNLTLQRTSEDLHLSVVDNRAKYMHIREQLEVDSMYLRSLVEYNPISNREMPLRKGSLLRVVNTYSLPNYWLAWCIDEKTGAETQLKKIPTPQMAKIQFGLNAYERVDRTDAIFRRPVCVLGPESDMVAKLIAKNSEYTLCESFEQVLETCSKGIDHGVMSVKDLGCIQMLKALQPIVFQTHSESTTLAEPTTVNVNSFLIGEKSSDLAKQAVQEIQQFQALPAWKPIGVI